MGSLHSRQNAAFYFRLRPPARESTGTNDRQGERPEVHHHDDHFTYSALLLRGTYPGCLVCDGVPQSHEASSSAQKRRSQQEWRRRGRDDNGEEDWTLRATSDVLLSTLPKGWKVTKRRPEPGETPDAVSYTERNFVT